MTSPSSCITQTHREHFQVVFLPSNQRGKVLEGTTLIEASRELGGKIESLCGGMKSCGKCRVKLVEGNLSPFTDEEAVFISESERAAGYRLSCAAQIKGDVTIFVPEETRMEGQVTRKSMAQRSIELKPAVASYFIELTPPSFQDPLGDFDRLKKALSNKYALSSLDIDYPALLRLSHILRQGDWKVTAVTWMDQEILDIKPGRIDHLYGLAIDIGTTTIVGYLCSLINGEVIATQSMMNPQILYGEDVISRITYATTHQGGLETLHRSMMEGLNRLIEMVTEEGGVLKEDIYELTMVGNTAMHHFFLGIDPQYLAVSPFPPALHQSFNAKARDLGLKVHPSAKVHLLPIEAGFVGADNVGVLIAEEPYRQDDMVLIIDIGTNGELVMGNKERLISSSCATGPALEGGHIQFGMRAAPGAIERVLIEPYTLEVNFKVVGEPQWHSESKANTAKGICGSGIIDAVAELYKNGIIDKSGRFKEKVPSPRLRITEGTAEFVVVWGKETSIQKDITLTQKDIRNVQLAKGAIYAGAKLMMKRLGIEKLDKVVLTGAFGSYIDKEKALVLGMFPDCDLTQIYAVGNAAGDGARLALLNREKRTEADEIARKVEYVELSIEEQFQKEFIEALQFPHMKDPFPHLKNILFSP